MTPETKTSEPKPTLYVKRGNDVWYADFSATPEAARIHDLFSSALVPTPFLADADPERVRARVALLNPQYTVVVIR